MTNWEYNGQNLAYFDFVDRDTEYIQESVQISDTGIVLDFDSDGALVGIETFKASQDLPEEVKEKFDDL